MSARSRRRFQRVALLLIGSLLVVIGARQLAYAASSHERCDRERLGYYEEHENRHVHIERSRHGDDIEMHVIVN